MTVSRDDEGCMGIPTISVVVPFFNERETLLTLCLEIIDVLESVSYKFEVILVDDGSTDNPAEVLSTFLEQESRVSVVRLRGNFGKSGALAAGFDYSRGDIVFTLDADLQDHPKEIPRFLEELNKGFDMVVGYKKVRKDPWHKVVPSRVFNYLTRLVSGLRLRDINCGFKCMRRVVVDELKIYGELHRFVPMLAHWRRFAVGEIEVEHRPRIFGRSKYGIGRFHAGALDLLTLAFFLHYGTKPSRLFGLLGLTLGAVGFSICAYLSLLWFVGLGPIGNRPLFFLGILLILVGCQFLALGLLSELQSRALHMNERPYSIACILSGKNRDPRVGVHCRPPQ